MESLSDDDLKKHILENTNIKARVINNKHKKVTTRELSKGDTAGIIVENTSDKSYDVTFAFKLHGYELTYTCCGDEEEEEEAKDGMVEQTVTTAAGE